MEAPIMSRPHRADATRELLLDAAAAAFAERGFDGARVDDIATRAGVNKALIYTYYGDKEGLYRAVLSSRLAAPAPAVAPGGLSGARAALEGVIRHHFRLLVEDRAFARLVAWDLLSTGRRGRDVLAESAGPALDRLAELVRDARGSGALRAGIDPELFRAALVALALGYSLQHSAMREADHRNRAGSRDEEFVDYACRLLLESAPARGGSGGGDPPR
jgi:AcrR family transcriptional regulator